MSALAALSAGIPSPPISGFDLGPLPVRFYALAIILGVILGAMVTDRRYTARGGPEGATWDMVIIMVPIGIVGARIYHVISSPSAYFGENGDPVRALYIWEGGLGIWGGVAAGALAAWWMLRSRGLSFTRFADAAAPGLLIAQAVGRLGNYVNQELYGAETEVPWGLQIDAYPGVLFHPTFLYELLWNLAAAALLILLDRRFRIGGGRLFALYVVFYTAGRVWIEYLRIDDAEMVLGLRLNVWTSILLFTAGLIAYFLLGARERRRREQGQLDLEEAEDDAAGQGVADPDSAPETEPETPTAAPNPISKSETGGAVRETVDGEPESRSGPSEG
ncbi:prolipoprotein diacylglyceryl transferase [Bogoriella caseilytica]|uniref:Phosphatidylglycerol--prolipoprotein diacylglyceryl transferase n=1 Tax=Bogoriella caseilytica TaxID=56055 RepID=A0A3N2B8T0_9MICO|nr:prolipoprotein diacylglyceryl transferase [Bogoriella caseilytica]ROR71667.1 prolipoprotein diacylglyceryl transferase [Bogoriella caseilytica]